MSHKHLVLNFLTVVAVAGSAVHAEAPSEYMRLDPSCPICTELDDLLVKYSTGLSAREQLDVTFQIARVMAKISVAGKVPLEQHRAIYYAIKAAAEVIDDDFDAETVVRLIDVRKQAPKAFDEVFWHFPVDTQKVIVRRMQDLRDRKVRPDITIPKIRDLE